MSTNLGRASLSWSDAIWKEIDAAVLAEVGQVRVVQKVFPGSVLADGALTGNVVPADLFDPKTMSIAEGKTLGLIEIQVDFQLTDGQVGSESTLHTGKTLARLAAKSLALAEDEILFQGTNAPVQRDPAVRVKNLDPENYGLLGAADAIAPVKVNLDDEAEGGVGAGLFAAVTQGIATLIANGQPAPHALFLETSLYADAFAPVEDSGLATIANRLAPLLQGGFYCTGALPHGTGLLVSLPGDPTTLYIAQDAVTAFTQEGVDDGFHFRVFERLQVVARDHRALLRLQVKQKKHGADGARRVGTGTGA